MHLSHPRRRNLESQCLQIKAQAYMACDTILQTDHPLIDVIIYPGYAHTSFCRRLHSLTLDKTMAC